MSADRVENRVASQSAVYSCPMHPEVAQQRPGSCPKCGMALEPVPGTAPAAGTEYVCPMHPEVARAEPGSCAVCEMALESRPIAGEAEPNPELASMSCRFWISLVLTVPILSLAMGEMILGDAAQRLLSLRLVTWVQLVLATPVVLWGGWPFFRRGWASIVNRSPNMFTLIAIGTGMAYAQSVAATLFPGIFPDSFRTHGGEVGCTSRPPPPSRRSCFSVKCSSCALTARPAARSKRFWVWRREPPAW